MHRVVPVALLLLAILPEACQRDEPTAPHRVGTNVQPAQAATPPIAFATNRDGNYEIYVMKADGTNILPVTANGATNEIPRFSPDSMKIIFASSKDKSAPTL